MKKYGQYNTPSKTLSEALICAIEAITLYGTHVIIKHLPNNEHENPLKDISKDLNDPFNWKCISQFHRTPEEMEDELKRAKNDTERDLLQNWTWIFGEPEAIELYKTTGKFTAGLLKGIGTCSQVRIKDMVQYLRETGDNERADLWDSENQYFNSGLWTPKTDSERSTTRRS